MGVVDRVRKRLAGESRPPAHPEPEEQPEAGTPGRRAPSAASLVSAADDADEAALWATLREDPNDVAAFHRLATIVRQRAAERQTEDTEGDPQREADDAVWSLAEELAHSPRAWYPLVELGRLSLHDDREAALRRLGTAADRDPDGLGLATALGMLRDERMPGDAVNLGVGHWRPREHALSVGRHLVEASIEAGRIGDARRHLTALLTHPDTGQAEAIRDELSPLIEAAEAALPPRTPAGGMPLIDLRELREARRPS